MQITLHEDPAGPLITSRAHMGRPAEIDAFALCASPFAAPGALALFGLAGAAGSSNAGLGSLLFWQIIMAASYAPFYLAASLPVAWLLWRIAPGFCSSRRPIIGLVVLTSAAFALTANARAFGWSAVGPFEPESFSFFVGLILNAITFVWLSRRAQAIR